MTIPSLAAKNASTCLMKYCSSSCATNKKVQILHTVTTYESSLTFRRFQSARSLERSTSSAVQKEAAEHTHYIFTYALTSYIATFHTTIPTYVAVNIAPTSISHAHSCHLSRNIKDSLALSRVPHGSLHLPQLCQKFYMFKFNATLILQLAANHYCAEIHDGVTETMDQLLQG